MHDVGIAVRRLSTEAIANLDVSDHVRAILTTITTLANQQSNTDAGSMIRWLHTLGYPGHINHQIAPLLDHIARVSHRMDPPAHR
jgi:hypothetical protein